jgi:hypothetical protein
MNLFPSNFILAVIMKAYQVKAEETTEHLAETNLQKMETSHQILS